MDRTPKLLQREGWACLDWLTGIVRINTDSSNYHCLKRKLEQSGTDVLSNDEVLLLETVTHESFHYLQICTSAFLFQIVSKLFESLNKHLVRSPINNYEDLEPDWPPQGLKDEFLFHVGLLNIQGPKEISTLAIVESAAFYMQKRYHWKGLTADQYGEMLAGELPQYRAAYEVAAGILGTETAFLVFPIFAEMALWTSLPHETFVPLCEAFARLDMAGRRKLNLDEFLKSVSPYYQGTPVPKGNPDIPIYNQTIRTLDSLYHAHKLDLYMLMSRPYARLDESLTNLIIPPMLFNHVESGNIEMFVPDHMWPHLPRTSQNVTGPRGEKMKLLVLLHELSLRIQS